MDTGFGKGEATSPNYGQLTIGTVPKLWTTGFLRNQESWTFKFQMDMFYTEYCEKAGLTVRMP